MTRGLGGWGRRSDARIVENGFATSGGLSESAKAVLGDGRRYDGVLAAIASAERESFT